MLLRTDMGVLVGKGGFYGNVFRITPPLCFSKEDAGMCVYALALLSVPLLSLEWCMSNVFLIVDFFVDVMDIALSKI